MRVVIEIKIHADIIKLIKTKQKGKTDMNFTTADRRRNYEVTGNGDGSYAVSENGKRTETFTAKTLKDAHKHLFEEYGAINEKFAQACDMADIYLDDSQDWVVGPDEAEGDYTAAIDAAYEECFIENFETAYQKSAEELSKDVDETIDNSDNISPMSGIYEWKHEGKHDLDVMLAAEDRGEEEANAADMVMFSHKPFYDQNLDLDARTVSYDYLTEAARDAIDAGTDGKTEDEEAFMVVNGYDESDDTISTIIPYSKQTLQDFAEKENINPESCFGQYLQQEIQQCPAEKAPEKHNFAQTIYQEEFGGYNANVYGDGKKVREVMNAYDELNRKYGLDEGLKTDWGGLRIDSDGITVGTGDFKQPGKFHADFSWEEYNEEKNEYYPKSILAKNMLQAGRKTDFNTAESNSRQDSAALKQALDKMEKDYGDYLPRTPEREQTLTDPPVKTAAPKHNLEQGLDME